MGEVINLRSARKTKQRIKREAEAERNRQYFGQTKTQRQLDKAKSEKAQRDLDSHKIEGPTEL